MEENKFVNLIDKISTVATLDRWSDIFYDSELDTFVWKKDKLSRDSSLIKVSHEVYLYLTPKEKIEGIIVEYLKNNFTKHNTEYKDITKLLNKKIDNKKYTLSQKNKDTKSYFDKFVEGLKVDIYKDAIEDKNTIDDLNFVLSSAFAS